MIKSSRDKETEKIYSRERSAKLPGDIQQIAVRKLRMINNAQNINDLRMPPSNRLEKTGLQSQYDLDVTADTLGESLEKEVRIYSQVA